MTKRCSAPFSAALSIALAMAAPCIAEGVSPPPNPISPPAISRQEVPTVMPPSAPTLSGVSPAGSPASGTATHGSSSNAAASGGTASALSMLGLGSDNALLKALSGASGGDEGTDALSALLGGTGATKAATAAQSADGETLKKILELLEKQEARTSGGTGTGNTGAVTATATGTAVPAKQRTTSGGELLRFSVNGYSVLPSVTALVSSVLARDGSFLLTGDRAYALSGRSVPETFYLLCRKTGPASYQLFADVTQGVPNERSIPWRLSRMTPLAGSLTGDLLVFRTTDPEWRLDLVIRIVGPTVPGKSADK